MTINPCPKCYDDSKLGLIVDEAHRSVTVECRGCGFRMQLETKLPLKHPGDIQAEWDRRTSEMIWRIKE